MEYLNRNHNKIDTSFANQRCTVFGLDGNLMIFGLLLLAHPRMYTLYIFISFAIFLTVMQKIFKMNSRMFFRLIGSKVSNLTLIGTNLINTRPQRNPWRYKHV